LGVTVGTTAGAETITAKETSVVRGSGAYGTGVVVLVVMPKISSGNVLPPPAVSRVRANSSRDSVNPNNAMPGRTFPVVMGAQ